MANVLAVTYFVLGVTVMHTALLVWITVMLPTRVRTARRRAAASMRKCLLGGMAIVAVGAAVAAGFLLLRQNVVYLVSHALDWLSGTFGINRIVHDAYMLTHALGWLALSPFLAGLVLGEAALVELFARRLRRRFRVEARWWPIVLGAGSLSCAYFLPLVGWFVFLPTTALLALGCGVPAVWRGRSRPVREPAARPGAPRTSIAAESVAPAAAGC
jgi:hypothetical protein